MNTEDEYHEIILGDDRGNKITLVGCFRTLLERQIVKDSGEYKHSEFHVSFFCIGFHFSSRKEIKFKDIIVKYSYLRKWAAGIFKFPQWEEKEDKYILKVNKTPEEKIDLNRFSLIIRGVVSARHNLYDASFKRDVIVTISADKESPLEELFPIVYHLKNFLGLAIGERISILTMEGKKTCLEPHEKIRVFSHQTLGEESSMDRFSFYPPPIEYQTISNRLEFYLRNWFNLIEKYEATYELFFATFVEKIYPVNEFLNLIQALEAYHCRKFENRIISDDLFDRQLPKFLEIVNEFPKEHRCAFQSKI